MTDAARGGPGLEPGLVAGSGGRRSGATPTGTAYVESPERVVVVDLDHLDLPPYVFEGSAAQIWVCVDGERTETEIVTDLAEAYDVPAEVVAPDVRQFVDRLRDLGLIVGGAVDGTDG